MANTKKKWPRRKLLLQAVTIGTGAALAGGCSSSSTVQGSFITDGGFHGTVAEEAAADIGVPEAMGAQMLDAGLTAQDAGMQAEDAADEADHPVVGTVIGDAGDGGSE
jgi:hypothetical protein